MDRGEQLRNGLQRGVFSADRTIQPLTCVSGAVCEVQNPYYSQCLAGSAPGMFSEHRRGIHALICKLRQQRLLWHQRSQHLRSAQRQWSRRPRRLYQSVPFPKQSDEYSTSMARPVTLLVCHLQLDEKSTHADVYRDKLLLDWILDW